MPLPDSRSATPSQWSIPGSLRNTLLLSRTPPLHSSSLSRHSTSSTPSTSFNRTYGRQTPQEEPQVLSRAGLSQSWEMSRPGSRMTRPSTAMTSRSYITTSPRPSSTMDGRICTKSPRLSVLERAQEARREEDALLIRAARRESLAHKLAPGRTNADGFWALPAEHPQRYTAAPRRLPGQDTSSWTIRPQHAGYQSFNVDVLATILEEKHNMDPERASRVMRIWDAVIKCLDEISSSLDASTRHLTCDPTKGMDGEEPTELQSPSSPTRPIVRDLLSEHQDLSEPAEDTAGPRYPCPFRKRNPVRFNIREHESCAKAPFSFTELRHHLASHHKQTFRPRQCRRCKVQFDSDMALLEHLMLPKDRICDVDSPKNLYDQEDGISPDVEKALHDPKQSNDSWTWESIWNLLFPCDTEIPDSDFHPIVELFEVDHAFDAEEQTLKKNLRDTLRLLLPQAGIDDQYCGFLSGQLDLVFQVHRASVMRQCLEHCGSTSQSAAPPLSSSSSDCTTTSTETDGSSYSSARRSSKRRSAGLSLLSPKSLSSTARIKTWKTFASTDEKGRVVDSKVTPMTESFGTTTRDPTSRESLDSAIGMSITCCDLCNQDPCRCREVIMSCINASPTRFEEDRVGYWKMKELQEQEEQELQQQLKRQPVRALRRTGHINGLAKDLQNREPEREQDYWPLGKEAMDGTDAQAKGGSDGGRVTPIDRVKDCASEGGHTEHSPQSFKQRVLRERHFSYVRGS
ncbi:hypothetical protein QC761_405570 [Podospora bellae-mahoneyi]|uniref:C2H2-type domain-containing protein n=1 Tax=Podospora bellae-mahoneyi TaxID=2093777 RepID=A0ABR0FL66_9PEZI|nr:hypothetical protein QC761_405570 [Podospora bellae-mahoneyi]